MAKRSQKVTLTLTDPIDIINEVEQKIKSIDFASGTPYKSDLIDPHKFFMNYRQVMPFGNPAGLKTVKGVRLTSAGWGFMKKFYEYKRIELRTDKITPDHLLNLDRFLTGPYHMYKSKTLKLLYVFHEMDQQEFTLFDGDLNLWCKAMRES